MSMDFNTLLQQAERLNYASPFMEDMPRVERTITQVLQAASEMHARVTQSGAQDMQAYILLGSKGIDLPKIQQKLERILTRTTFQPLEPVSHTDIQGFLKNERENAILSIIDESAQITTEAAEKKKWKQIREEWHAEKVRLMNSLIGRSENWIDIQRLPEQTVLNEMSNMRSVLDNMETAYAAEVAEYNSIIITGGMRPNMIQKFAVVSKQFLNPKVDDMWEMMKYMVDVTPLSRHRDPIQSRVATKQFIIQGRKYLENRYKLFMNTIIKSNLREAQRGGVPSTYNMVLAYVGISFTHANSIGLMDAVIEGKPLWPVIYYCLRSGDMHGALRSLKTSGAGHEDLAQALEERIKRPELDITTKMEQTLKLQYCNKIKNSTDPYKKIVYCVIGGLDINDHHPEVAKTTDDFLWLQLSILRNEDPERSDYLTYAELQIMILEKWGEKHFNANEQIHLYFQVLTLTGQFEAAIEFLTRTQKYRVHGVHMGLALFELCMIGLPRDVNSPLLSLDVEDPKPMRRLNIARLIMLYVKKFEISNPEDAIQYYYILRNLKDSQGRNLFLMCVCDLAIECRDYQKIFGKRNKDGILMGGLFQKFECIDFDVHTATNIVAEELVRRGMFEDAIQLFDMAENYEQALSYLCRMLSQVVHKPSEEGSLRERLSLIADNLSNQLRGNRIQIDSKLLTNFNQLNTLIKFFDLYHEKKYQAAIETLCETRLVPQCSADIDDCLMNFKRLNSETCKVFPHLLLTAMDIYFEDFKAMKSIPNRFPTIERDQKLNYIREKAKCITNLAAIVPYRMPLDTNKRLMQIEILMH